MAIESWYQPKTPPADLEGAAYIVGELQRIANAFQLVLEGSGTPFTDSSDVEHDKTTGFKVDEHIDHASVTVSAGNALSGGGDLTANFTLDVVEGDIQTSNLDNDAGFISDITGENIQDLNNVSVSSLSAGEFLEFDGTDFVNTTLALSDITDSGAAAAKGVTGSDSDAVTGTAGTDGNLLQWNSDGDAADSGIAAADVEKVYADTYDSSGGTDVTSGAVVQLDTERTKSGTDFSLSSGVVTYNSSSKLFLINAQVGTDTGGGRDNSKFYLEKSTDGGSTWSEVSGTTGWMYNRVDANGESQGATSALLTLNSGDKLRLWAVGINASGPVTTLADACGLTITQV